jgi:signal peptidase I
VLSLLVPGLGQLYAGDARRAAGFWVGFRLLGVAAVYLIAAAPGPFGLAAFVAIVGGAFVFVAVDAGRQARPALLAFPAQWWTRWYVVLAAYAASAFLIDPALKRWVDNQVLDAFVLRGESMAPSLLPGDYLFVAPIRGTPQRGDVVVYETNTGPSFHRIVGIPGDTIAMVGGRLTINRAPIAEPYATHDDDYDPVDEDFAWQRQYLVGASPAPYRPSLHTWGPLAIPRDSYFLLGDSRNSSLDSRYVGFTSRASMTARPLMIYFSWDSTTRAVRWSRIGHLPR